MFDNDEEIEVVEDRVFTADFTASSNFKSYDELKTRLDAVLAGTVTVGTVEDVIDTPVETVKVDTKTVDAPEPTVSVTDDEDDTMSYFEKLNKRVRYTSNGLLS